ncbi:hypothetical protein C6503_25845 [Candidatus Poribacteria bacterium]|nr:MAG: hypothetical protein C6503_25845 [Candidatus Poribacteria bacterium]
MLTKTLSLTSVRYVLVSCTLYFVFFSTAPLCAAAESAFADSLFQEGDYLNAAHEYKRLLFLHPDTLQSDFIAFRVAASYQNAGKLKNAIRAYQLLIDTYPESNLAARCKNNIAQCHILLGDSKQGLSALKQFLAEHAESDLAPRAHFTIGVVHIDKREWTQARQVWNDVSLTYPDSPFAGVSNRLAQKVEDAENLPRRSPTIAAALSVFLPGSGQVYTGRTVDGLYAFVSVAVLGGASFYYADRGRYEVAVPIGILGAFFYGNSIYQGIQTARTFNGQHEKLFRSRLQQEIRESGLFGVISPPVKEVKLVLWESGF